MVTAGNLIQTNIHIIILEHKLFYAFVIVVSSLKHTHAHTHTHTHIRLIQNLYTYTRI